jgi:hypothetical protein
MALGEFIGGLSMRYNRENLPDKCCVIISPELCPKPALYADTKSYGSSSPYACETHKHRLNLPVGPQEWRDIVMCSYNGGTPVRKDRGPHTCWFRIPDIICSELPAWDFLHDSNDERWKLCETHAQEFKAMRISFDLPGAEGGYDGKRICTCSSRILWSIGCQCGRG